MHEPTFYRYLLWGYFALSGVIFVALLRIRAPYGRYHRAGYGPGLPTPWAWALMESPAPVLFVVLAALGNRPDNVVAWVFFAAWQLHYLNRSYLYPWLRRRSGGQTALGVFAMAAGFNLLNAYLNGRHLFTFGPVLPVSWLYDPRFIAGALLFGVGFGINQHSDWRLLALRTSGRRDYQVPRGGLFDWVSCPNYLGEILQWSGWALATWSLPGLAFAVWTAANLVPRALTHHRWYQQTFPDYPAKRKALLPFLL